MPALDAVEKVCKALPPDELALARKALYLGLAMQPLSETYGPGDFLVRDLVGAMPEGRALLVAARVEDQSVVQFHVRDARSAWSELDKLLTASAKGERQPEGALMFSCVGRGQRLYGETGHDSRVLRQHFESLALTGFFGNGEIGQVGGRTWIHGYTTALILFRTGTDA
ncbi:MAG: FIST C-terminal domain-containing protein [Myxococcota bacterium]|nr:FIST C-terminal domain-containing protein [Myxococcota bacterium]